MDEEIPVPVKCAECGAEGLVRVQPRTFTTDPSDVRRGKLWFRQQAECPGCGAPIELQFAVDEKTGQPASGIEMRGQKRGGLFGGLLGRKD